MIINSTILYYDDDDDDDGEVRCISHRYKVMTLLVSARKINNKNKQQQMNNEGRKVELIRTKYNTLMYCYHRHMCTKLKLTYI